MRSSKKKFFQKRFGICALLVMALAFGGFLPSATAQNVLPGVDLFVTPPGGSSVDSHFTTMPIPADFFNPGSEPFFGVIVFQGDPILPFSPLGMTDVIVERKAMAVLPICPSSATVPIEILALNLVSVNPITVKYVSDPPQLWDVRVCLSSVGPPPPTGTMTIRKQHANGGTFSATFNVQARFTFTEVGNPGNIRILDPPLPPINLNTLNGHWMYAAPLPFILNTSPGGLPVDHDCNPVTPDRIIPASSNFAAGMRSVGATCAGGGHAGKVLTQEEAMLAAHGVLPPQRDPAAQQQEGACCLPDGSCVTTFPQNCAQAGGNFFGPGTRCRGDIFPRDGKDDICLPPPPVWPPAATDWFTSTAILDVEIFGVGRSLVNLTGTTVVRRDTCQDSNGNGLPDSPTQITSMNLIGETPTFGPLRLHQSPFLPSMGLLEQAGPGPNPFPMESFFDVFIVVETALGPLHNQQSVMMLGNDIRELPPLGTPFIKRDPQPVPLFDQAGAQRGLIWNVIHTPQLPCQNHYKTWKVFSQPFPITVSVLDQFMQDNLQLDSIQYLSNPTRKITFNPTGNDTFNVVDTTDHLTWYKAKGRDTLLAVDFVNQFQRDTVVIDAVKYFLVPTQKFPHNPPNLLDHYKAYRIRNPQPFKRPVELQDQFDLQDPRGPELIDSLVPRFFLTPARKNAEPVFDTVTHYVAYEINPKRPVSLIRDTKDQFGIRVMQIDSSEFVLVPTTKLAVIQPCIPGTPDCNSVTTDPCLLVCPKSDVVFRVTVTDGCGNPICDPNLWLDFSGVPCAIPCPGEEPLWPIVKPDSCRNGVHYFTIDAGAQVQFCTNCRAFLFVNGAFCRNIPVRFFDLNADLCVTAADQAILTNCIFAGACPPDPLCLDYNCDGFLTQADIVKFAAHLGHCCPPPPCNPCDSIQVPNCLVMCPGSDVPYTITLKDCNGNPIGGLPASQMWLDFSGCPCACPCPEELPPAGAWPRVYPNGSSDASGNATWYVDAGMRCPCLQPCVVKVNIVFNGPAGPETCMYSIDQVRSTDNNCNFVVEDSDFDFAGPPSACNDYNCDGIVSASDIIIWIRHRGHHCVPCDQFRQEIRIRGCDENHLHAGDTCQVCLFIFNNRPDTCCIDSLVFQQAGFNLTSTGWSSFCKLTFAAAPRCIPPGDSAEFCCPFIVPPGPHGCVRVLKYSDCCDDTIQHNLNVERDPFNCGRRCDSFRVRLDVPPGQTYCVTPLAALPAGWTATYTPALPGCFSASTTLLVVICTNSSPAAGEIGCVTLFATDPFGNLVGTAEVCKLIDCMLGDINKDQILTAADVVCLLNCTFLGTQAGSCDCDICAADLNFDGVLTAADVVLELNFVFQGQKPPGCL